MLDRSLLLECHYCGHRSAMASASCEKCGRDYTFLTKPVSTWDSEQCYRWLRSQHYQLYERFEAEGSLKSFSEAERLNFYTGYLVFQVEDGGVAQYFVNPCGPGAPECVQALKSIGATKWAALLTSYLKLFPQGRPSESMDERREVMSNIPRWRAIFINRREELLVEGLEKPREDLPVLLASYIDRHFTRSEPLH
jgi:hypothetical protein